jgi:ribosomal protein S18 acetylase RimI-like enzyme
VAEETVDQELRQMAQHRGLKLVKSRRRKAGTGDFGKFGLTDDKGKPLIGFGKDGLTATAADIQDYLRTGAASTWRQSAKVTPARARSRKPQTPASEPAEEPRVRRGTRLPARAPKTSERQAKPARIEAANSGPRVKPKAEEPQDQPSLLVRIAKPGDAGAVAKLLKQLNGIRATDDSVARHLVALRKASGGLHVAELAGLVGCAGWALVPTIHRGLVGRITVLLVDGGHRRQGIGTQLLRAAEEAAAKKGCVFIEAMSDIEIKNSHNFFRALKFEQTSYRFARKLKT